MESSLIEIIAVTILIGYISYRVWRTYRSAADQSNPVKKIVDELIDIANYNIDEYQYYILHKNEKILISQDNYEEVYNLILQKYTDNDYRVYIAWIGRSTRLFLYNMYDGIYLYYQHNTTNFKELYDSLMADLTPLVD